VFALKNVTIRDITIVLLGAFLGASPVGLLAGDAPSEKPPASRELAKRREEWQKLTPEEREAKLKEWRKTNGSPARAELDKRREQFKNMTPEEREAKRAEIKARLEKRIAELREKQTNATLSPSEQHELMRREQVLKRFQQQGAQGPSVQRPVPREPAAPPPPER